MRKFRYLLTLIIPAILLTQIAYASHEVDYRTPTSMITTVGQPATLQLDIKNTGSFSERYQITISASLQNEIEITNPNIRTQIVSPGQSISVSSNIRTLTESDNALTIKIFRDGDSSHFQPQPPISISVKSKKFSLPEFGLTGFLQITAIAAILYFVSTKATRRKSLSGHPPFRTVFSD